MSNLKKKIISTGNTIIDKKLEEEYLKDLAEIHKANLQLKRKKKNYPIEFASVEKVGLKN